MAGNIILGIAYGIDVLPKNDPYVATAEKMLHSLSLATQSGGRLFSMIPWCGFLSLLLPNTPYNVELSDIYAFLVPWRRLQTRSSEMATHCGQHN
jgi:hypothetical protein